MSENIKDATLKVLIKIQDELADHRERLIRIEGISRKQRRDTAGMLVIGKAMAGDFAEQMAAVVERVETLEAKRS
jgi:ribulose bisphosphate carboxylase small subunit